MSENELNESVEAEVTTNFEQEEVVEEATTEFENTEDFVDKKDEDKDEKSEDAESEEKNDDDEDDDKKKPKNQHSLEEFEALEAKCNTLEEELDSLRAENEELRSFKLNVENQQKDELIASYYMLSDEDKADVINHKAEYSYDEIKAKLAVVYVDKNVNFDMSEEQEEVESEPSVTFSLDEEASEGAPAFLEALRHTVSY